MNRNALASTMLMVVALSCALMQGQQGNSLDGDAARLLGQLSKQGWEERSAGFYGLVALGRGPRNPSTTFREADAIRRLTERLPKRDSEIRSTLTKTLDTENRIVETSPDLSESYSDYYGDLIAVVTEFKDPGAAETLSGALGTGNMVMQALASLGDAGARAVMEKMHEVESREKAAGAEAQSDAAHRLRVLKLSAHVVMGNLLDPANADSAKSRNLRDEMKSMLKKAAVDQSSAYIRIVAVKGLAKLTDNDIVPFLQKIAQSDAYDASKFIEDVGAARFPVRAAALSALAEVGTKEAVMALGQMGEKESGATREQVAEALTNLVENESGGAAVRKTAQDALSRLLKLGNQPKATIQPSQESASPPSEDKE